MSEADAKLDAYLRAELGRHPHPRLSPGLSTRVLARVAERERPAGAPPRGVRALLAAYWLTAAVACVVVVARNPLPAWSGSVLLGLAVALTPVGYAAALWPARARAWLEAALRPLAPDAER